MRPDRLRYDEYRRDVDNFLGLYVPDEPVTRAPCNTRGCERRALLSGGARGTPYWVCQDCVCRMDLDRRLRDKLNKSMDNIGPQEAFEAMRQCALKLSLPPAKRREGANAAARAPAKPEDLARLREARRAYAEALDAVRGAG